MPLKRARIELFGRVQGVGFRFFAQQMALKYRVDGYVRNTPQGSVEVVAEGEEDVLAKFIEELKKGPPSARVRDVRIIWGEAKGDLRGFRIAF
ncbi:MAG: acylphosphatase [bacterium]